MAILLIQECMNKEKYSEDVYECVMPEMGQNCTGMKSNETSWFN